MHQLEGRYLRQRCGRLDPHVRDHFNPVVLRELIFWGSRHKKAGIEPFRQPLGCDPVVEVRELSGQQSKLGLAARLTERHLFTSQRGAQFIERHCRFRNGAANRIDLREQNTGLLKALADGGDIEIESAFVQAQTLARRTVVEVAAQGMRLTVSRVDNATGKHPGPAELVFDVAPLQQEHLYSGTGTWRVAHQQQRGSGSQRAAMIRR